MWLRTFVLAHNLTQGVAPLDKAPATALIQQLVQQLKIAHLQGVVHCDIRPSNVIRFADGAVRLGDWGCSGELDDKGVFESQPVGVLAWLSDSAVKKWKNNKPFKYTIYDDLESLAFIYCALMIGVSQTVYLWTQFVLTSCRSVWLRSLAQAVCRPYAH